MYKILIVAMVMVFFVVTGNDSDNVFAGSPNTLILEELSHIKGLLNNEVIPKLDDCIQCPECPECEAGVPKTGQTSICETGDDGDLQMGIAWPYPRFTDNGDGTVTDNMTGLMWTQDTQEILGQMTWTDALNACNNSIFADYDDWRLPNVRELLSLVDYGASYPALPNGHPFVNLNLLGACWSSTTYEGETDKAWYVRINNSGVATVGHKVSDGHAWPVRSAW